MVGEPGERVVWAGCGMGCWGEEEACQGHQLRADARGAHWQAKKGSFGTAWGGGWHRAAATDPAWETGRMKGSRLQREPNEPSDSDSPEGLALGGGGSGKLLAAPGPILYSGEFPLHC